MSSATRRTILKPIALGSATPERPPGGGGGGLPPHPSSGPPKFHPQQPHATAHDNMPLNTAPAHSDPSKLPHLNSNSQQQQNHSSHPHAAGQPAAAGISRDAVRSPVRPTDAPPSHPSPVRRLSFKSSQTEGHAAATNTTSATATVTTAAATHVGHDEASRLKTTTAAAGAHSHSGNKSNSQHAAHPPQQSGQAAAHHNQQAPSQHNAHARPQPGGPSSTSKGAVAVVTATAGGVNGKKSMQVPAGKLNVYFGSFFFCDALKFSLCCAATFMSTYIQALPCLWQM